MILPDLRDDARKLISRQMTSVEYPDVELDANINKWYQRILAWIIPTQGEWEINGDVLTIDTAIDQMEYEIPVTFLRIFHAEIMYKTGGTFVPLTQISMQRNQEIAEGNATRPFDNYNAPTIEVYGDVLKVRPAPTEVVVNGLKIWAQLAFQDLSDITPQDELPDLAEPIHRILSIGPAMDWCIGEKLWDNVREFKYLIYGDPRVGDKGLKGDIEAMYATRTGTRRDRMKPQTRSYR